jgi:hypothetical protein
MYAYVDSNAVARMKGVSTRASTATQPPAHPFAITESSWRAVQGCATKACNTVRSTKAILWMKFTNTT